MITRLQTEFVPFSGDCSEMQFGKTRTREWLMSVVNKIDDRDLRHQRETGHDTIQGFFIISCDGKSFGWLNDNDANHVQAFMDRALVAFKKDPSAARASVSEAELKERWGRTPPPGCSVVRVFSRIRPLPKDADDTNNSVGRDHLWIYPGEVVEILSRAEQMGEFDLPRSLVARMVRFHLIDNVRGEPDMWKDDEIKLADFRARREKTSDNSVAVSIWGEYEQETHNARRGLRGKLAGHVTIDKDKRQIVKFRAYAQGKAWGVSTYTPGAPAGKFPLVIGMVETSDQISRVVPPEAVYYDYEEPSLRTSNTR